MFRKILKLRELPRFFVSVPSSKKIPIESNGRGAKAEGGESMFVFPAEEEMENIRRKTEAGLELEDWEI